nr:zinc ribbon domain-containing protein [Candidatus Sigynarchaeota archaeon]
MPSCPRCNATIAPDAIVCAKCRLVVRYFCESCNNPIFISTKYCTKCGAVNSNYDPTFDKPSGNAQSTNKGEVVDTDFDQESAKIAKEIAELKASLVPSRPPVKKAATLLFATEKDKPAIKDIYEQSIDIMKEPTVDEAHMLIQTMAISSAELQPEKAETKPVKAVSSWDCEVVVHSKNKQEPVHIGLGSSPDSAKGVPGTIFFTQSSVIFITYIPQYRDISDIFAYFAFNIDLLSSYTLDPAMEKNKLVFNNSGLFKKKFPGVQAINVHFSWSTDAAQGDVDSQMFVFKSLIDRLKLFHIESHLLSGDYLFTTGKSPKDPGIQDIVQELKGMQSIYDIIADKYPSLVRG